MKFYGAYQSTPPHTSTYIQMSLPYTLVCKVVYYIHRKCSLYLPLFSVNLVLKVMGTPDEIPSPTGLTMCFTGLPQEVQYSVD